MALESLAVQYRDTMTYQACYTRTADALYACGMHHRAWGDLQPQKETLQASMCRCALSMPLDPKLSTQCYLSLQSPQAQLILTYACAQALRWDRPSGVLTALSRPAMLGRRAKGCRKLTGSRCACSCKWGALVPFKCNKC